MFSYLICDLSVNDFVSWIDRPLNLKVCSAERLSVIKANVCGHAVGNNLVYLAPVFERGNRSARVLDTRTSDKNSYRPQFWRDGRWVCSETNSHRHATHTTEYSRMSFRHMLMPPRGGYK